MEDFNARRTAGDGSRSYQRNKVREIDTRWINHSYLQRGVIQRKYPLCILYDFRSTSPAFRDSTLRLHLAEFEWKLEIL